MDHTDDFSRDIPAQNAVPDLLWLMHESDRRCLSEASRWACEQLAYMSEGQLDGFSDAMESTSEVDPLSHQIQLEFTRKLIGNMEFSRAKFFMQKLKRETPLEHFLYFFSWYMACQRKRAEKDTQQLEKKDDSMDEQFAELTREIERLYRKNADQLGQVRHDGQQTKDAKKVLIQAIEMEPRCWPAWDVLSQICAESDLSDMEQKPCCRTWQYILFVAEAASRLQIQSMAKDFYSELGETIFTNHPYVMCSLAEIRINMQENKTALEFFERVRKLDPYRIEQMNLYSNALFIRDEELKLAELADFFNNSHRFSWETCIILANYYSIRKMHDKAIEFLKRAIRIRPDDASTYILLGQEQLQTKNPQDAILAYRRATAIDNKSFRAWYCLGQLYEILKLPAYSLFYYQQAVRCKPTDSRMLIATGVMLVKLRRHEDAEKCFKKAFQIGDVEGNALTELGSLYVECGRYDQAARAYEHFLKLYCDESKNIAYGDEDTIASVCQFLSKYYFGRNDFEKAYEYSQRCLHFDKTKEHAAHLLRKLKVERAKDRATFDNINLSMNSLMNSFVHQSTPASACGGAAAQSSRILPLNESLVLEPAGQDNNTSETIPDEEMSMEDGDEEVSF